MKMARAHFPSPGYDAPGFPTLHRGPLREGVARLYADAGSIATPMYEEDGVTPVLNEAGQQKWHVNPSRIGLTWAYVLVGADGQEVCRDSGTLLCPIESDGKVWTAKTDMAEWYALMRGLRAIPVGLDCEVATDNLLTIHRMFHQYPTRSIPPSWVRWAAGLRRRLIAAGMLRPIHLKGHPLKHWLAQGHTGTDEEMGFPVSPWNELVDKLCGDERRRYEEGIRANDQGQGEAEQAGEGGLGAAEGPAGSPEGGAELAAAS